MSDPLLESRIVELQRANKGFKEVIHELEVKVAALEKKVEILEQRKPTYVPPPVYGPRAVRDLTEEESKRLLEAMRKVANRHNEETSNKRSGSLPKSSTDSNDPEVVRLSPSGSGLSNQEQGGLNPP
jgi:hypothetical protein